MPPSRPLTSFRLLSFDIYGTLIDWESGLQAALTPLSSRLDPSHPLGSNPTAFGAAFNRHERAIQARNPEFTYDVVLKEAYKAFARELGALPAASAGKDVEALLDAEGDECGASIGRWPAFPDTVPAMRRLKEKGYKLVPLSNVDRASFSKTLSGPLGGLREGLGPDEPFFDAVYTAQDIGSYKPDLRNFEYLLRQVKSEFGVDKEDILQVAQSLFHDHEPAKKIGLQSVWIARGEGGATAMGGNVEEYLGGEDAKVAFGWKFKDLGEFADAIAKET